ncbi:MAG: PilZ domain-containing protein [Phycisphaeraceae bacterium]
MSPPIALQPPDATVPVALASYLQELEHQQTQPHDLGRREPRYPVQGRVPMGVRLSPAGDFRPLYRGWATDLSHHGMGILIEHQLPTNSNLAVNLEPLIGATCIVTARIVYCRQLLPQTYRLGLAFL